jgi:hypothetical protein
MILLGITVPLLLLGRAEEVIGELKSSLSIR